MVKSIIKRIIVGIGVALCLTAIRDGGLIGQVYAMSCDTNYETHFFPYRGVYENTWTDNTLNNPTWSGQNFNYNLPLVEGYDYVEISAPALFSINSEANISPSYTIDLVSSGSAWAILNDTSPGSGITNWQRGYYKNGRFYVRYYYQDYPNLTSLHLTGFRMTAPTFLGNFSSIYIYLRVEEMWFVSYYKCDGNEALQQSIEDNTQAVEDVNNSINDDSTDDPSSDISTMNGKLASNNSITQLLTLPIQMYQNILNAVSGSCSSFSLGSLYDHNLTLPCINLENLLGSTLYGIIDILISGLFILSFRKKMVDIFNHMTSLNDRGNEVE